MDAVLQNLGPFEPKALETLMRRGYRYSLSALDYGGIELAHKIAISNATYERIRQRVLEHKEKMRHREARKRSRIVKNDDAKDLHQEEQDSGYG